MVNTFRGRIGRIALAATMAAFAAAPVSAETLADALASAYKHSGLLEQNRALLRAADEDVASAIADLRPIISWSVEASRSFGTQRSSSTGGAVAGFANNTLTANLTAQLSIYDFGKGKLAVDAAKETVLSTREALIGVEQQVMANAVAAFMAVRSSSEQVALSQSNVRVITEELRAARDRFDVGDVTRTDVALTEAALASANANQALALGNYEVAREQYRATVGHYPKNLVAPTSLPRLPGSEESAKSTAVRQHPSMLRAQHDVAVADINVLRAQAAMKPDVTLEGGLRLQDTLGNNNFSNSATVTLKAAGPIYAGGKLSALYRQAIARRDAQRGNLHVVRHTVEQDVGNAFARLQVATASRDASERQIRAATVAFRGVREEATLGTRTTLDVLNAEQELLDARAGFISAAADEYEAAYNVLASIGQLTAASLKLNVPVYDPSEYYNLVKTAPTVRSEQGKQLDRVLKALGKE
ncbi:TolC family outer membrane protein [Pseudoprimorskyibacter insulae]|uniref:Outer membrane efflux protein BepC n=1 Tax=Pseudoprimorskyibacter insulae TaxID=1695997 RepID=A0A2R8B0Y6_9RHOB|nr:TolC family outer membrane protein [Pseudoprimorskyibacter insulae]SPF81920.1 Outer membrane efflux protein BepC [Pseudoprimorskyibacter insulae]